MIRRLLITFILVVVLGLFAFYGVSYFTKEEESLKEIPIATGPETSELLSPETSEPSTSSESMPTETAEEIIEPSTPGEKPSETSGTSTTAAISPGTRQATSTQGTEVASEEPSEKPEVVSPAKTETPAGTGPSSEVSTAESTRKIAPVPPSPSVRSAEPKPTEQTTTLRKPELPVSEPGSSSVAKDKQESTGDTYVVKITNPIFEKQISSIRRFLDQMNIPIVVTPSTEKINLNVVAVGYFRTENEARSVAPYIARNINISDYMVTKASNGIYYTVQLGAYYNKSEADRLVARLSQQRFPVRLETKKVPVKVYYVKTRALSSRQQANRIQNRLRDLDLSTEVVKS